MSTSFVRLERTHEFIDKDGILSFTQDEDDIRTRTIDFTDHPTIADDGTTISSVAYDDNGVTTSNKSNTTTAITFDITGIGYTEITLTMADGQAFKFTVNVYDKQEGAEASDYDSYYGEW